ncbi:MAG: Crp/Fnr family transcriptional regulator [Gammaproteobacteria bacterium]|nr:Crp/Fnr family transcriptional regulator [Gammaproteobacteria bacterium]MCB1922419.1 Crp/Fnr family transcriptional regulator [Gammaproteobacteria bacterium]
MPTNRIPVDVNVMLDQPLFSELDEPRIREIARGGWIVRAKRGTRILGRGEILEGMYLVTEGNLKLYMLSCGGDERVLRVLQPGDSFGEVLMFNMLPSPVYVDTLAQASLAFFPRDVINAALTRDPDFTATMLRSMSAMMRNLIVDLETCCLQNAQQRTANYLLRAAREAPAPHHEIRLPAPKAVVASTLNISAETFSRELHRLQDEGIIEINRRIIAIRDLRALEEITDGTTLASMTKAMAH